MSLYKSYIEERTDRFIIENEYGFVTYSFMEGAIYIVDIFVIAEARHKGVAQSMTSEIIKIAKEKGIKKLIGSVVPKTKGSTYSLKAFLTYGFQLESSVDNFIVLSKEIGE